MGGERTAVFESLRERLTAEELATLYHLVACPWCSGDFLVDLTVARGPELLLRSEMPPPADEGLQALGARDRMIAGRRFGEAVLVTLDLTYAKVQGGAVDWAAAALNRLRMEIENLYWRLKAFPDAEPARWATLRQMIEER